MEKFLRKYCGFLLLFCVVPCLFCFRSILIQENPEKILTLEKK
ncbi:hypothetical protein HMPREF6123_0426 [Oribacterium sinus F0268]|uniref:Uncharacterized protein n=1 Tax=Oribacterium sinus F0268 TaxID=585501 RepID=C2KVA7_9FIRM|nr:hypothetical protein HMPREF6123_0426 [Oribacterium sinus F0268]